MKYWSAAFLWYRITATSTLEIVQHFAGLHHDYFVCDKCAAGHYLFDF